MNEIHWTHQNRRSFRATIQFSLQLGIVILERQTKRMSRSILPQSMNMQVSRTISPQFPSFFYIETFLFRVWLNGTIALAQALRNEAGLLPVHWSFEQQLGHRFDQECSDEQNDRFHRLTEKFSQRILMRSKSLPTS